MTATSWSHSRLVDFEKCKRYFELKHIQRIPEPERPLPPGKTEHANDRGSRVHDSCEQYVRGDIDVLAPEANKFFGPQIDLLRTMYKDGLVQLEGDWGLTSDWAPWGWSGDWTEVEDPKELGLPVKKVKTLPTGKAIETNVIYTKGKQNFIWTPPWLRMKIDALVMHDETTATVIDYKGLPLQTMIPTPTGWTTMGGIQVGDQLFDAAGDVCTVQGKSQVKHLDNYRITFDDTSVAECDCEHLWVVDGKDIVSVTHLEVGDLIHTAKPLDLPESNLPIDPYVLGIWLADGKHTSGEICKPDNEVWAEIQRRGYEIGDDYNRANPGRCRTHTVKGLRGELDALGVLGDKQIPQRYLRASYQQRLDLLRGLFDGDGSANHKRKQAVLNTTREDFALQVQELLLTLGQRPLVSPYKATGFGKTVDAWVVSFRPNGINPFLLPRKANKVLKTWGPGESGRRKIVSIERIAPQPTQCILVDSSDHTFLCTEKFIPTHNTGRKYGNEVKHNDQLRIYQLATFQRYPKLQQIFAELWYLDQDEVTSVRFSRAMGLRYQEKLSERGNAILQATAFPATPTVETCKWCQYGPWAGGQCQVGVRR